MATTRVTVRQLVPRTEGKKRLPAAGKRGTIVGGTGKGKAAATQATSGDGIASPLRETTGSRKWHTTAHEVTSSDGFLVLDYVCTKELQMLDAKFRQIKFEYLDVTPS